jgi:hypothetical protein
LAERRISQTNPSYRGIKVAGAICNLSNRNPMRDHALGGLKARHIEYFEYEHDSRAASI